MTTMHSWLIDDSPASRLQARLGRLYRISLSSGLLQQMIKNLCFMQIIMLSYASRS